MAAFATSYIKTEATQETRNADAASMTGTNFSSWYNAGEGTFYIDVGPARGTFPEVFELFLDGVNYLKLGKEVLSSTPTTQLFLNSFYNNASQLNIGSGSASSGRLAFAISVNDTAISGNGAAVTSDTTCIFPQFNSAYIGYSRANSNLRQCNTTIKKIAYYPQRLTNANLQALTA